MKKLKNFLLYTFFTTPKNAAMWAEQNEKRISTLWSTLIFLMTMIVLLVTVKEAFVK